MVVAALALPAVLPEVTNIIVLTFAALALLARNGWPQTLARLPVQLVLAALAILAACSLINLGSADDVVALIIFAPLIAALPLTRLFTRNAGAVSVERVALAAGTGSLLAFILAAIETTAFGIDRAGVTVNNPIHFAAVTLLLGLVSLAGFYSPRPLVRWLAALGAVLSLWAVLLSGTRGAMLAAGPSYLLALLLLGAHLGTGRRMVPLLAGLAAAAVAVVALAGAFGLLAPIIELANRLVTGELDGSTLERLALYRGAWNAFLAAPLWGHGIADMMDAAILYGLPAVVVPPYEHLHSDIADFAVIGGVAGLVAYGALIAAPAAAAWRAAPGPKRFLGLVVPLACFTLGLTNPMIGLITQTVLYTVLIAVVAAMPPQRPA